MPKLEPTAPIRLADRNHAHYPSRRCTILKKRSLNDGLPVHMIPSTRESSEDVVSSICIYTDSLLPPDIYIYIYIYIIYMHCVTLLGFLALLSTLPKTTVLLLAFCAALLLLSTLAHQRWLGTCLDFSTHKCRVISG